MMHIYVTRENGDNNRVVKGYTSILRGKVVTIIGLLSIHIYITRESGDNNRVVK